MLREKYTIKSFNEITSHVNSIIDKQILLKVKEYRENLNATLNCEKINWECFSTFWPPRLVKAYREDNLICFFGAGLSIPSGLPSWDKLLSQYFGLEKSILSDEDLKSDPLTLAELASHQIGSDRLQVVLRNAIKDFKTPSTNHLIAASLRLPFYVTTNYDSLFEEAWKLINEPNGIKLNTIVNEDELIEYLKFKDSESIKPNPNESYLFKIHGSVDEKHKNQNLILTRSDYRYHYRYNSNFFKAVKKLLSTYHVLFLGFSHQDPEVTKIVEDVIFEFEDDRINKNQVDKELNLYSLQFDMRLHTPDVFGARGFLTIAPPDVSYSSDVNDYRSLSLAQALTDLIAASGCEFHQKLSLDETLSKCVKELSDQLQDAKEKIGKKTEDALNFLKGHSDSIKWLEDLREELGDFAGQGVYLLNSQGFIKEMVVPKGLDKDIRLERSKKSLSDRPYFKHAKTFPEPFISDSDKSIFNDFSTFFICAPILEKNKSFCGLIFSACQIGIWSLPIDLAERVWSEEADLSVLLIDSNGVCLIPPNKEFKVSKSKWAGDKEDEELNKGYSFNKLLRLSRRDKLVSRLMQNVVPLLQDDDVLSLSGDLKYYTVIAELEKMRWKFGISKAIELAKIPELDESSSA